MIEGLLLAGGGVTLGLANYILFFKVRKYMKVFDTAETAVKTFNIGYLESLEELPKDEYILLAGKAQNPKSTEKILEIKNKQPEHLQFINSNYKYSIFAKNNNQLHVVNNNKTLVFNLKQFSDKQSRGLAHNTNIAMIGKYSNSRFIPLVLMGQNKDALLKSLDQKIVNLRSKSRNLMGLGIVFLISHKVYKSYNSK